MSPNWTNDDGSCAPCHDEARGGSPCFIHHTKPPPKRRRVAKPASPSLDELDALHAAATAGRWYRDERGYIPGVAVTLAFDGSPTLDGRTILRGNNAWPGECRANEDFAMHTKNAWPAFSARLRAAEAALRGMLRAHPNCHAVDCGGYGCDDDCLTDDPDGDTGGDLHVCECGAITARNAARAALGEP